MARWLNQPRAMNKAWLLSLPILVTTTTAYAGDDVDTGEALAPSATQTGADTQATADLSVDTSGGARLALGGQAMTSFGLGGYGSIAVLEGEVARDSMPDTPGVALSSAEVGALYDATHGRLEIGARAGAVIPIPQKNDLGGFDGALGDPDDYVLGAQGKFIRMAVTPTLHLRGARFLRADLGLDLPIGTPMAAHADVRAAHVDLAYGSEGTRHGFVGSLSTTTVGGGDFALMMVELRGDYVHHTHRLDAFLGLGLIGAVAAEDGLGGLGGGATVHVGARFR
jgi:hypothetical protein